MPILSRAVLILALLLFGVELYANTITPQIGGGISQFDGGIGTQGAATVIVGCASPTAPNGVLDLSQCSNASYAAVIF